MNKFILSLTALVLPVAMVLFASPASAAIDTSRDCDTVAIIKCGALTESELKADAKKGDVPKVYASFGISQSELTGFVSGVVWKDGRVTLGANGQGKLVATDAVTAGRWNNPTSDMTKIPGTDRAYRMSTSHFTDDGQIAFIKLVNGKFSFAVIKTCGNPVTAKPVQPPKPPTTPEKPNLTVTKDVMSESHQVWGQTANAKPGEQVAYKVVGTNTSKVTLTNVSFRDVLPQGVTFNMDNPHATLNGGFITNDLSDGMNIGSLAPGQKFELIYVADTSPSEKRTSACNTGLTNRAYVGATNLPERSDTAVVKVCAPPKAVYSCDAITGNTGSNRTFGISTYKVTALSGATFTKMRLDWGDGSSSVKLVNEIKGTIHQYAKDGTYTVQATAYFMVDGKEVTAASDTCTAKVTFKEDKPPVVETPTTPSPLTPTPGKLVDTGPGAIIGALASAIAGGTLAYRFVWLRRYTN